jgi:hypothetical protein
LAWDYSVPPLLAAYERAFARVRRRALRGGGPERRRIEVG